MATITKADLDNIENTPEARRARRLMESIEQKLNHDGRYHLLTQFESGSRYGKLTSEELEYLGQSMAGTGPIATRLIGTTSPLLFWPPAWNIRTGPTCYSTATPRQQSSR